RDFAGDVRPVPGVVQRVAVVGHRVHAVVIVDVPVAVVVDPVARRLERVVPEVGRQVGVGGVDAAVDDGDDAVAAAGRHVPRLGGVDVGVGLARAHGRGAGVVQAPLVVEERV